MSKQHHIVPNGDNGWCVKTEHASRASRCFSTKKDAINYGREVSRNQKTELYIHNKNGKIAQRDSHGNDPYPPKG